MHQCSHCELKFLELPVLAKHIVDHNDDFQKKALKQERRRLLSKQKALELAEGKSEKVGYEIYLQVSSLVKWGNRNIVLQTFLSY